MKMCFDACQKCEESCRNMVKAMGVPLEQGRAKGPQSLRVSKLRRRGVTAQSLACAKEAIVAGQHMNNSSRCLVLRRTASKRCVLPALRFFSLFVGVLSSALDWT